MIKLVHLTKTYKELRAVDDLNLEVKLLQATWGRWKARNMKEKTQAW